MVEESRKGEDATSSIQGQENFPLTALDRQVLSMTDAEHEPHTWQDLQQKIENNELHLLKRFPSDLKAYMRWTAETKAQWGSITNFVLRNRLHWAEKPLDHDPQKSSSIFEIADPIPFASPTDYKILKNDWPYGLAPGITHMVVWLKQRLPVEDIRGDLTKEGRKMVEGFVQNTFRERFGGENVLWFRNWVALQSVRALEHVHVLVKGHAEEEVLRLLG